MSEIWVQKAETNRKQKAEQVYGQLTVTRFGSCSQ